MPSIEFDINIKDFTFTKEEFIQDDNLVLPNELKKYRFSHNMSYTPANDFISPTQRKISFNFKLDMAPDAGTILLEGECVLNSPEQAKISFVLVNAPQALKPLISRQIIINCYARASEMGKEAGVMFPPPEILLRSLK